MSRHPPTPASPLPPLSARQRLACAVGAVLTTAGVGVSLLGAFVMSAPEQWLAPTREVMELAAQCDAMPGRHLREECRSELLASRLPEDRRRKEGVRLAGSTPPTSR